MSTDQHVNQQTNGKHIRSSKKKDHKVNPHFTGWTHFYLIKGKSIRTLKNDLHKKYLVHLIKKLTISINVQYNM